MHVEPFRIAVPDAVLTDLRDRLARTRFPDEIADSGWTYGSNLAYVKELVAHWRDRYDWRRHEAALNAFPQFRVRVGDLGIHFIHAKGRGPRPFPLVITHGWPGSVAEFTKIIGPLTDPAAHGGDPADAFDVVCPSMPGYGFSDHARGPGMDAEKIAALWADLMRGLGYARFGAQGGDWGSMVTSAIGAHHPEHLAGIHVNMPLVIPTTPPEEMTPTERAAAAGLEHYMTWDHGYSTQQSTRPQTVGYGLADSPVGQMAWIVEKFWSWTDCDGDPLNALTADELLDNVMVYWLTDTAASSARLYWESFKDLDFSPIGVPSGISIFPHEIFRCSRRWAEGRFTDLRHFNELDRGGHFAAFEQPERFVTEVRAAFRSMR